MANANLRNFGLENRANTFAVNRAAALNNRFVGFNRSAVNPFAFSNFPAANAAAYENRVADRAFGANNRFANNFALMNGSYPYGYGYGGYGYNPFGWGYNPLGYGYNPYGYGYGYYPNAGSYYSYGYNPYSYYPTIGGGYGGGGYGGDSYGTASYSPAPSSDLGSMSGAKGPQPLTAFGIPSEKGTVRWPLALRLMPAPLKRELLDKAESQLQIAARQAVSGRPNPLILREAGRSVEQLQQWLRAQRANLAEGTYADAEAFLRNLDQALESMGS